MRYVAIKKLKGRHTMYALVFSRLLHWQIARIIRPSAEGLNRITERVTQAVFRFEHNCGVGRNGDRVDSLHLVSRRSLQGEHRRANDVSNSLRASERVGVRHNLIRGVERPLIPRGLDAVRNGRGIRVVDNERIRRTRRVRQLEIDQLTGIGRDDSESGRQAAAGRSLSIRNSGDEQRNKQSEEFLHVIE